MTLVTLGLYTGVPHTAFRKMFLPTRRQLIELSKKSKIVENGLKISKLQACKVDQYLHRINLNILKCGALKYNYVIVI